MLIYTCKYKLFLRVFFVYKYPIRYYSCLPLTIALIVQGVLSTWISIYTVLKLKRLLAHEGGNGHVDLAALYVLQRVFFIYECTV